MSKSSIRRTTRFLVAAAADRQEAQAWFTAEQPVLMGAFALAVAAGRDDVVARLAWTTSTFLNWNGHWTALAETQRSEDPAVLPQRLGTGQQPLHPRRPRVRHRPGPVGCAGERRSRPRPVQVCVRSTVSSSAKSGEHGVVVTGVPANLHDASAPGRDPDAGVDIAEAEAFLRLFHQEQASVGSGAARLREVRAEIAATGTYTHTPEELAYGARVAWRNSSRCIARLYWPTLEVRDCRQARTAEEIAAELVAHLRLATNDGQIRSYLSVFAPSTPGRPAARVWNDQLIRYAGYRHADGVVGDPYYVGFTSAVTALGWSGSGGPFDVLPLVVETPTEGPRLFRLPADAVLEVPIDHPEYHWFVELALRWHAVPAIANMRLEIGGVSYPLAPFNGWYMGTEIGARNLGDTDRYNMLQPVAQRLGLHMSSDRTLWRDRALLELNRAVLYSFERHHVRISDHHSEARRFMVHLDREQRAGRIVPADWSWIVPPISGSATPVFHRYYQTADLRPNFYLDPVAAELGRHGASGCPARHSPAST